MIKLLYRIIIKLKKIIVCGYLKGCINGDTRTLTIYDFPNIICPNSLFVGKNCSINGGAIIHSVGGVRFGDFVTVSAGAKIFSTQYDTKSWRDSLEHKHKKEEVVINDGCWICAGAVILPGVKISGKNVVVGANSVVNKDILEDNVLVTGAPATIVKRYKK